MSNTIGEIKALYRDIKNKKQLKILVGEEFGISPLSVANHWFSNHWAIPEKKQERVLLLLEHAKFKEDKGQEFWKQ